MSETTPDYLILGANGQVGRELERALQPFGRGAALGRRECDLSEPGAVAAAVARYAPAVVVNAAAYTAVDRAESEPALARRINAEAVAELATACAERAIPLVHYSTDYVFAGEGETPYRPEDATAPRSVYGQTKREGEDAIAAAGARALVLRTSWVYAAHGHNFVRTMLRLAAERDQLRVIDDQVGAPTWAATIADVTALALHAWRRENWSPAMAGTHHLTAAGATSWHGFAEAIFEEAVALGLLEADRRPSVEAIASREYPQPAPRPGNSRLDTTSLRETFGVALPPWQDALRSCLRALMP
ncbi:dTDP-4-dehydrorhamnose reductase [Modicisalibacter tunisiensis]|uniref:dTDP-4-dehydrorhamnose reductase n=1 Tax=Modicisalibacter tunisiensis TaxID=390637 RepID=A0ABS7WU17_9GAMM|nr:dTDP-4-dehydrorhamnose reductase [Modicisalibacter tunisiensis]MBZ9540459.1 dTDP-4-dehydrorhamnose reductase [Modicisalibacter tunisiensis]MBZ9566105.1 dTDP-4-dehydrorhamnose reductase [Modicisalibacter tunisiensis]